MEKQHQVRQHKLRKQQVWESPNPQQLSLVQGEAEPAQLENPRLWASYSPQEEARWPLAMARHQAQLLAAAQQAVSMQEVMPADGEVMLAAEEMMPAAVQTFACLPAASPSLPFGVPACQAYQLLWPCDALCLFRKLRDTDMLTERP